MGSSSKKKHKKHKDQDRERSSSKHHHHHRSSNLSELGDNYNGSLETTPGVVATSYLVDNSGWNDDPQNASTSGATLKPPSLRLVLKVPSSISSPQKPGAVTSTNSVVCSSNANSVQAIPSISSNDTRLDHAVVQPQVQSSNYEPFQPTTNTEAYSNSMDWCFTI